MPHATRSSTTRSSTTRNQPPRDLHAEVTSKIVEALDAGVPPWRKPWTTAGCMQLPRNAVTGVRYRGINTVMLGWSPLTLISGDPRWATYKQAAERGWQVRGGERGTTAIFYKRIERHDGNADSSPNPSTDTPAAANVNRTIPLLRAFTVFHASQIDGIPAFAPPTQTEAPWRTPDAVATIMTNSGAVVRIGGRDAYYASTTDHIQMPPTSAFDNLIGYVSTLLHEAGHWTASPARLDRDLRDRFGSQGYAREEVRVELAQAMICAELGFECDFGDAASYLKSWIDVLKSDRREVFRAAADAQRIADYLIAFYPDYTARPGEAAREETLSCGDGEPEEFLPEVALAEAA